MWERTHGVGWALYERLLSEQEQKCAICAISLDEYRRKYTKHREFSLDHCHKTGAKRGLLCHNCNRAIGMMQDSVEILQSAIEYLTVKR